MNTNSREIILQRIRSGLTNAAVAGFADLREPPVPEVWPRTCPPPAELVSRFCEELRLLSGEPVHCATLDDARRQLAQLMESDACSRLGCLDRPLVRELVGQVAAERLEWVFNDWTAERIEQLPAALITAEALLADTGSCVVRLRHVSRAADVLPAADLRGRGPRTAACRAPAGRVGTDRQRVSRGGFPRRGRAYHRP